MFPWGDTHVCANAHSQIYVSVKGKSRPWVSSLTDLSLPYNLRQGLSIKHADFASQGSFGHSPASAYQVLDYRQVTVPVQHLYVCREQTAVFLCM